jgi:hypothetical protein
MKIVVRSGGRVDDTYDRVHDGHGDETDYEPFLVSRDETRDLSRTRHLENIK